MEHKIILITGSTDGIGKATAKTLTKQGHTVIIHGRNASKAKSVIDEIKSEIPTAKLDMLIADFMKLADVRKMADEFNAKYDRLDVLINNAGAVLDKRRELAEDGEEKMMTLNVISAFLITKLLTEKLSKSTSARVVFTSSATHGTVRSLDMNDLKFEKNYSAQGMYAITKLLNIWSARSFSRKFKESGFNIAVNTYHPGMVGTNFGQDSDKGFFVNLVYKSAFRLGVMDSIDKGARTPIFLATSKEVEGVTGKFFDNKTKMAKANDKLYSKENEKRLWDYCMKVSTKYLSEVS